MRSGHPHLPLVFLLVLTQLSVGAFVVEFLLRRLAPTFGWSLGLEPAHATHALVALGAGLLALAASIFHLGRPKYAFRAVLGLRTSWMSREILAFGAFAGCAALYAAFTWREAIFGLLHLPMPSGALFSAATERVLGGVVVASGLAGVFCSVMIYVKTAREWWSGRAHRVSFLRQRGGAGAGDDDLVPGRRSAAATRPRATRSSGWRRCWRSRPRRSSCWEVAIFAHLADKRSGPCGGPRSCSRAICATSSAALALGLAGGCLAPLVLAGFQKQEALGAGGRGRSRRSAS